MSTPSRLNLHGAVDLAAIAAQQQAKAQAAARASSRADGDGTSNPPDLPTVIDVTEATFKDEIIDRSFAVPVVVDLWATWCGPCKTLSPILERLAGEYAGRLVLAKIDVDANPQVSQAFRVQSIPTVVAVVMGQVVPLFTGALPEPQVRAFFDELLKVAEQQGLTGAAPTGTPTEPDVDPRHDVAFDAIERGDYDAAEQVYREMLAGNPADADATAGLAQVELLRRTEGVDPDSALRDAASAPTDLALASRAADALVLHGRTTEAFSVLIAVVRATTGAERDAARLHLLNLFGVVGPDDPAVAAARIALANALF
jgi:putative thioredoxin